MERTRVVIAVASLSLAVVATGASAVDAPAGNAHITGRITDVATGAGVSGMCVRAAPDGSTQTVHATTDASGNYTLNLVQKPKTTAYYRVDATSSCGAANWWLHAVYQGKVRVSAVPGAATTRGVNMTSQRGGRIIGTMTDANTGAPVRGVTVFASGSLTVSGVTAADGTFVLGGLPAGLYRVSGSGKGYLAEFVPHTPDESSATQFAVSVGQNTVVNDSLLPGDSMTGKAIDAKTGLPASSIYVWVEPLTGSWQTHRDATTGVDGSFKVDVLGPGTYSVCFYDSRDPKRFQDRCWKDQPFEFGTGTPVSVDGYGNTVAGIDQSLPRA
jgi:hypothetical protein